MTTRINLNHINGVNIDGQWYDVVPGTFTFNDPGLSAWPWDWNPLDGQTFYFFTAPAEQVMGVETRPKTRRCGTVAGIRQFRLIDEGEEG